MTHPIIKTDKMKLQLTHVKNEFGTDYLFCNHEDNHYHLPLNNAPVLQKFPLLPPLEDESNFFAEQETIKNEWNSEKSFKAGYNKAKEKYKWTDDDLRKALSESFKASQEGYNITCDEIIQSLQQSKYPVAFECEMELYDEGGFSPERKPKTITNSQGLTQLVGRYIY
jgi:hypothetical protein